MFFFFIKSFVCVCGFDEKIFFTNQQTFESYIGKRGLLLPFFTKRKYANVFFFFFFQQNLVKLANEKISERDNHHQLTSTNSSNTLQRPTVDVASQRTSLPDIPLTPRERDILEQTSAKTIRASHSTESILRDSSPPPKPPLPNRSSNPPPLPPKRKSQPKISQNDSDYGIDSSLLGSGLDR